MNEFRLYTYEEVERIKRRTYDKATTDFYKKHPLAPLAYELKQGLKELIGALFCIETLYILAGIAGFLLLCWLISTVTGETLFDDGRIVHATAALYIPA